jgi:hypothetical protein
MAMPSEAIGTGIIPTFWITASMISWFGRTTTVRDGKKLDMLGLDPDLQRINRPKSLLPYHSSLEREMIMFGVWPLILWMLWHCRANFQETLPILWSCLTTPIGNRSDMFAWCRKTFIGLVSITEKKLVSVQMATAGETSYCSKLDDFSW